MNDHERRMTYRVTSEWVALKRQNAFPSIDFLHPKTFSVDWNCCVLIRLLDNPQSRMEDKLEFEFVGSDFRKDCPSLDAGACVSSVPAESLLSLSSPLLPKMFARQTPVIYSGLLPWLSSGGIHFRAIAVPFGNSDGDLKYGLGALSHKLTAKSASQQDYKTEFLEYCDGGWSPVFDQRDSQLVHVA